MKKLIQKLVRMRNRSFTLDASLSQADLLQFMWTQALALLRGSVIILRFRNSRGMLRGSRVRFQYLSRITWGNFLKVGNDVLFSALGKNGIRLGHHVSIGAFSRVIVSASLNHTGSHIHIGDRVGIGEYAYLGGAGGLTIGSDTIVGQYFSCHAENHRYTDPNILIREQGVTREGIVIGSNCWIGSKVTVLDGAVIGNGCVVAAGAVVTGTFPDNSVIGGVPARILKSRTL
ncbi:MAG TPA: acyltransferase [Cyclobacteriaceae bacterium]|nr:acyltransferase [Cyclobacteriaceae bacterium]HMV10977.1 acyltransferase [Cyclobacteriaceae bacterium]HMV91810.1 acyltransferase [Cyclobacteriaceae bacterium]HMX01858.1 acyltransferase [Cyclobacteriaceae bacterium]HMX50782.1 acyltransferase [Cyclobacteriaceae bacterium]